MVQRVGGSRRKSRHKFKKHVKRKGKISLSEYFKELKTGQKVILKAEPAYQKGLYHSRFHGKTGKVTGKKGNCYYVEIKDKKLIIHPIHLKALWGKKTKWT